MRTKLPIIAGIVMAPVCVLGLLWQQSFIWLVCPQALVVMFLRQAQHSYDSLGAADYPDLITALFYYPVVGWILSRASRGGRFKSVALRVLLYHVITIVMAIFFAKMRNKLWGVN